MLKKSTSRANVSAITAADGTSTIIPSLIDRSKSIPSLLEVLHRVVQQKLRLAELVRRRDQREHHLASARTRSPAGSPAAAS
jgi:hypothetical protein